MDLICSRTVEEEHGRVLAVEFTDSAGVAATFRIARSALDQGVEAPTVGTHYDLVAQRSTTTTPESRARIAYTAYGRKTDFKNFRGEPMPSFDDLPEQIREAWAAASGVIWDLAKTGRATI